MNATGEDVIFIACKLITKKNPKNNCDSIHSPKEKNKKNTQKELKHKTKKK